jgi:hypothetical protein
MELFILFGANFRHFFFEKTHNLLILVRGHSFVKRRNSKVTTTDTGEDEASFPISDYISKLVYQKAFDDFG